MAKILLDYVFPISVIEAIPQASTAFLRQAALVCKPKTGQEGNVGEVYECFNMNDVAARTDNTEANQLFTAGMSRVFIILANDLGLAEVLNTHKGEFFTLLISNDFTDADVIPSQASLVKNDLTFMAVEDGQGGNDISIEFLNTGTAGAEVVTVVGKKISVSIEGGVSTATQCKAALDNSASAMNLISVEITGTASDPQAAFVEDNLEGGDGLYVGAFEGVTGFASTDKTFAKAEAVKPNRNVFFKKVGTGSKNMLFAFGKLLSNLVNWRNQQFITMPFNDDVDELGEANSLFEDRVSFVLNDDEFGNRLAFFVAGGKAIIAPYILKNLRIDMQSRALQWIAQNQPQYTIKEASLLEARIQEDVLNSYISRGWIESGSIRITLVEQNFVASGTITVPTPKALWRVFNEMTETN